MNTILISGVTRFKFDDGPSPVTEQILDTLEAYDVKATFFWLGEHVAQYPDIVQRAFSEGHHVASHTHTHLDLTDLDEEGVWNQFTMAEEAFADVLGVKPTYMRPPYGDTNEDVDRIVDDAGYTQVFWNIDTKDYDVSAWDPHQIVTRVQSMMYDKEWSPYTQDLIIVDGEHVSYDGGYISLQHDLYWESAAKLPELIETIRDNGFTLVTVAECLGDDYPYAMVYPDKVSAMNLTVQNSLFQLNRVSVPTHLKVNTTSVDANATVDDTLTLDSRPPSTDGDVLNERTETAIPVNKKDNGDIRKVKTRGMKEKIGRKRPEVGDNREQSAGGWIHGNLFGISTMLLMSVFTMSLIA